jgi:N-acyl homoserine lactone hydrolase
VIDPVLVTEVTLPEGHPRAGDRCPVYGFVIWHEDGPVLVDTGVGRGHDAVEAAFAPKHHPIEGALAERGIHRDDVVMVINSHLHFDHCGNNRAFAGVPMVVQRAEYELAHQAGYTITEWVDFPGARWELVEGETEVLSGVRVLPTPGHTPGHQAVVIEARDTLVVIAAQALYEPGELEAEQSIEPLTPDEAESTAALARAIKSLQPTTVHFSHDHRTWP